MRPNLPKFLIWSQNPQFQRSYELDLLLVPNFITLGIYFVFGTNFSWNERIDTCFNVECVLLGHNFVFLGGYLAVTARYLVITGGYCLLLVVTAHYRSLPLIPAFSMNVYCGLIFTNEKIQTFCLDKFSQTRNIRKGLAIIFFE